MRWYFNDSSVQGQFGDPPVDFEGFLRRLLHARGRFDRLREMLYSTRSLLGQSVSIGVTVADFIRNCRDRDLRRAAIEWLDRTGPFVDDDRLVEPEDYFEYANVDVTNTGLGEAARRVKALQNATTFSCEGGAINFQRSPLIVDHGIVEERLGAVNVHNLWTIDDLHSSALNASPQIGSWRMLIEGARERFPELLIPDSVYLNPLLAREGFDVPIRDRSLVLLDYLNRYMLGRGENGAEGPIARDIVQNHFTGDRALFTGESPGNQRRFSSEMTFVDPQNAGVEIFAHWHGKISHRFFRLHFEWPVPANARQLKVLYLGPKLTKD
jgi:hypothetical protein